MLTIVETFLCLLISCFFSNGCLQVETADPAIAKKDTALVIGIMSALPGESGRLLEMMEGPVASHERGMRTYYSGKLFGINTVLVSTRIGKVAAAAATTNLILEYGVDMVIFIGVAGDIDPRLHVGDVVIGSTTMQYDMDASPFFPPYEIPLLNVSEFHADPLLEQFAFQAAKRFVDGELQNSIPKMILDRFHIIQPKVMEGLIITGDQVITQEGRKNALRREIPRALGAEMEGASVAQVCYEYGVPCVVIRTISDYADQEKKPGDMTAFIQQVSGYYAEGIIKNIYSLIITNAKEPVCLN